MSERNSHKSREEEPGLKVRIIEITSDSLSYPSSAEAVNQLFKEYPSDILAITAQKPDPRMRDPFLEAGIVRYTKPKLVDLNPDSNIKTHPHFITTETQNGINKMIRFIDKELPPSLTQNTLIDEPFDLICVRFVETTGLYLVSNEPLDQDPKFTLYLRFEEDNSTIQIQIDPEGEFYLFLPPNAKSCPQVTYKNTLQKSETTVIAYVLPDDTSDPNYPGQPSNLPPTPPRAS